MPTMSTMSCGRQCIPRSSPAWTGWGAWICGTWITTPRWGGAAARRRPVAGRRGRAGAGRDLNPVTAGGAALPSTPSPPPPRLPPEVCGGAGLPQGAESPASAAARAPGRGGEGRGGQVPLPGAPDRPPPPPASRLPPRRGCCCRVPVRGGEGRLRHPRQKANTNK